MIESIIEIYNGVSILMEACVMNKKTYVELSFEQIVFHGDVITISGNEPGEAEPIVWEEDEP